MDTKKGKARFNNFQILLESVFSSTIIMVSLIQKLPPEEDALIQWHMKAVKITNNLKVKIDFTLPELSTTKIVKWNCHLDDSAKERHDLILGRDLLTELGLNLKFSDNIIKASDGPFKRYT